MLSGGPLVREEDKVTMKMIEELIEGLMDKKLGELGELLIKIYSPDKILIKRQKIKDLLDDNEDDNEEDKEEDKEDDEEEDKEDEGDEC